MKQHQSSRRDFLKKSALLSLGSLFIPPAIAQLYETKESPITAKHLQRHHRADIRSVDFDSHNFMLNFR
ncbi:twin-arginine translocation signal domain-containing protein [Ignatzschineria rhizosphaerae]|uniref:Twin-arginine translocation signal domain-containing protein n=1 Tax=Ignatzschineria rhizosphaerae TaxID=2923279 RepID=A0ABY3WYS4_9GAMM|nr:twin-arginine translocation signal domain-containing protein [Ignatzschineria rhizosphaerae]UNM95772.1 twin-arginine translocation signal domain-containing protein [Ignatzschineria rhizosphaerae]